MGSFICHYRGVPHEPITKISMIFHEIRPLRCCLKCLCFNDAICHLSNCIRSASGTIQCPNYTEFNLENERFRGERLQKNRLALLLFYELCFLTTINMVVIRMGAFAFKRVGWFNERLREAAKVQVYFIRCDESYRTENDDCTQKNRTDGQTTLIPVEQNTGLSLNRLQAKDMMWARRPSHWTVWK